MAGASRMRAVPLSIVFLLVLSSYPATPQVLFHGTSVILAPYSNSSHPASSTWQTANFFCYFTPTGYVSFGWWLGGNPSQINDTRCSPRSDSYDWYEYSNGSCSSSSHQCRFRARNYLAPAPSPLVFEEDYVVMPLRLAEGERGMMFLSYLDRVGGGTAIGVRRALNRESESREECEDAWQTMRKLVGGKEIPVPFAMENPCGWDGGGEQAVMGLSQ